MNYKIIYNPAKETVDMLKLKMNHRQRERLGEVPGTLECGAIAIFQANLPNLYYYADLGVKTGGVMAEELMGNLCPQATGSMAFYGEISAVETAMKAVLRAEEEDKAQAKNLART